MVMRNFLMILLSALVGGISAFAVTSLTTVDEEYDLYSESSFSQEGAKVYRTVNLSTDNYPDFTYAASSAVDAVVYVRVTISQRTNQMADPFFQFFFGAEPQPKSRERQGSGSGVIVREDGYIVTNNHVIEGATKIEVTLNNNKTYEAVLVGADPATDVALLKIEEKDLPVIPFTDSDNLRLGEWVLAIGSPYDLRSTITAGIVSAKGRSMPNYTGEFKIESFIQTDAAVNPGNSGGALVDKAGRLVGVNTAIISQTGSYTGYSFAIPSNIVKKIVDDLINFGSVKRAVLGIVMQSIDDKIAKDLKLSSLSGVYITEVVKNGAADKAGIKSGDVLVAIDSTETSTTALVQEVVNRYHPGDKAEVTVIRDGKKKVLKVEFQSSQSESVSTSDDGSVSFYGSVIQSAPEEKLKTYGLKHGVEIAEVGAGKLKEAGAIKGFIILYVNDQPVKTPEDVVRVVKNAKRSVFIEGVTPAGRTGYFGFGVE